VNGRFEDRACAKTSLVSKSVSLHDAAAANIQDGNSVAMEGFAHLMPFAAPARGRPAGKEALRGGLSMPGR
jgi:hypothetical protein